MAGTSVGGRITQYPVMIGPPGESASSGSELLTSISGRFGMVERDLWGSAFSTSPDHSAGGEAREDGTGGKVFSLDSGRALLNGTSSPGAGYNMSLSYTTSRDMTNFTASPGASRLGNRTGADSWLFAFPFRVLTIPAPVS